MYSLYGIVVGAFDSIFFGVTQQSITRGPVTGLDRKIPIQGNSEGRLAVQMQIG
jgi:hypothetical protein